MNDPLKVFCVRTGDKYSMVYVLKLRNMVARHLSIPYEFWCITDKETDEVFCELTPYQGWWGKVSLFAHTGPCLYFDLDTVILGSIDPLAEAILEDEEKKLFMLKGFIQKRKEWMSGIMAWRGDWSFLTEGFHPIRTPNKFKGDQNFFDHRIRMSNEKAKPVQSVLPGVCSYKRDLRPYRNKKANGARVVCFHGNPRPHQVYEKWVVENWK